ncbi:TIGR02391 family protein [Paradevosia shaoguanensis]|uniref:TIGR02391 family protein n=1 Tax=Paradevosia shaoguanensis TaxID=1335043 RepID=UPI003C734D44
MREFLENIRAFQEVLLENGAKQSSVSAQTPRMAIQTLPEGLAQPIELLFATLITEEEVVSAARDLFASGHFSLAVQEAFKALEKFVQIRTGNRASGTMLMEQVFSPKTPTLFWTTRETQSELDEQTGYHKLFIGAMQGVRNPCTHEFNWVDDSILALELLSLVQHLLRKARGAQLRSPSS